MGATGRTTSSESARRAKAAHPGSRTSGLQRLLSEVRRQSDRLAWPPYCRLKRSSAADLVSTQSGVHWRPFECPSRERSGCRDYRRRWQQTLLPIPRDAHVTGEITRRVENAIAQRGEGLVAMQNSGNIRPCRTQMTGRCCRCSATEPSLFGEPPVRIRFRAYARWVEAAALSPRASSGPIAGLGAEHRPPTRMGRGTPVVSGSRV